MLVRGRTVAALLADEAAFWYSEGLNPAEEVLQAARPAMLSTTRRPTLLSAWKTVAVRASAGGVNLRSSLVHALAGWTGPRSR